MGPATRKPDDGSRDEPQGTTPTSGRPDLFIIGAAKSGTSSLYDYLAGHPEIYMSPVKETAYFSPDVPGPRTGGAYGLDLQQYLALFEGATNEKRLGEASPHYLYSRVAPRLIRDFQPDPRIVAILRNPVDVAYSLHGQRLSNRTEEIEDFEAALAADQRPDAGGRTRRAEIDRAGTYRDRARYAAQLERWFEVFAREQCHVMVFDDFTADPATEFRKLLEFLDVDPSYLPRSFEVRNPSRRTRSSWRAFKNSAPVRWARHRLVPVLIGSTRTAQLAGRIKASQVVRPAKPRPPLDPDLRRRLEDEFAEDVARLSELLGRDMSERWFRRPSPVTGNRETPVSS
jgi:hypothetical protein